jgi:hypothetical protein
MGASELMHRAGGAIVLVLRRPDFAYEWKWKRIEQKLRRAGCPRPRGVKGLELVLTRGSDRGLFVGVSRALEQNPFSRTRTRRKGATNA